MTLTASPPLVGIEALILIETDIAVLAVAVFEQSIERHIVQLGQGGLQGFSNTSSCFGRIAMGPADRFAHDTVHQAELVELLRSYLHVLGGRRRFTRIVPKDG